MQLHGEFFTSAAWLKPRRFSEPEAFLDMVGCYESHLVVGHSAVFFSSRWSWTSKEVEAFCVSLSTAGWWDRDRGRIKRPAIKAGVRQEREPYKTSELNVLHKKYNEMFGKRFKLTSKRKAGYCRLLAAGLEKASDRGERFEQICRAVQREDFYMSNPRYHDPESLFRTHERCEAWLERSAPKQRFAPGQYDERKKAERLGTRLDATITTQAVETGDIDAMFKSLSEDCRAKVEAQFNQKRKRLSQLGRFQDSMEDAIWADLVMRAQR